MVDKQINIVISMYNEEAGIIAFSESLQTCLDEMKDRFFLLCWVNDGSTDHTQEKVDSITSRSPHIRHKKVELSKNFGHEAAMLAGIDLVADGPTICMDADGQHPPERLKDMISAYDAGADIVLTERLDRADGGLFMKFLSRMFYSILNRLSEFEFEKNSSDFFLISAEVAEVLKQEFRERNRFIRGIIQSIGFQKETIRFEAPQRTHGESHYSFFGLLSLSFNAIFSFSDKPLRLAISVSLMFIMFTILFGVYSLYNYFWQDTPPSGYTSIVLFLSASFSVLFVTITVLSLYFEKALKEIRQRPIYIVKKIDSKKNMRVR